MQKDLAVSINNDVNEHTPLVDAKATPKPWFYNTEDYWPVWIGFIWYTITILIIWWGLEVPQIIHWSGLDLANSFTPSNIGGFLLIISSTLASMHVAHKSMDKPDALFQYFTICILSWICKVIGNNNTLRQAGMGDSVWCILIGFTFRNLFRELYPKFKTVYSLEFFIKISIVLLAINLKEVAISGAKGLVVAWVETLLIIIVIYFIGIFILRMDKNESVVTSCGVSICGSSAAMAITDSIKSDKTMTFALITIMSIFTIPLIPTLPIISKYAGFNVETAGAWIGGSVDSTGAVSACASLGGVKMLHAAIIIKMLQNILIGPVALVITSIWIKSIRANLLWEKFPKFVLGFVVVGIVTTMLPDSLEDRAIHNTFIVSEWFSSIAFILIGMDIDLFSLKEKFLAYKKVLALYLIGQTIDLGTTLGISYLMFTLIP